VWRGGERVPLGGRKQRTLLAALLVRVGRVVSLDQLIDDLWPADPPARAAASVQVFVSDLRRVLETGRPPRLLVTSAPGYVLRAEAVDAHDFERLTADGRAALHDEDAERAADLLARAEALWRGPALADVADEPFARAEAARWEELRLGCAEDRVDAELALGRHATVVAELRQRVDAHPLRERVRAQLMLALHRSGRHADALAVHTAGRRILRDELGLEPGSALQALQRRVLAHDPGLDWSPPQPVVLDRVDPEPVDEPGRVLVVDDSGTNRRLLGAALAELGHEVRVAEHGRRALEVLRTEDVDVVLLDVLMPVLDGYSTLAEIKADAALSHLPVIMVSTVHELDGVVRCLDLGATDFLPKPFSAAVLRARLRSSLAAKRLRDDERADSARLRQRTAAREAALRAEIAALRAELEAS
jgi:DNA-binding response OmpR family regulator